MDRNIDQNNNANESGKYEIRKLLRARIIINIQYSMYAPACIYLSMYNICPFFFFSFGSPLSLSLSLSFFSFALPLSRYPLPPSLSTNLYLSHALILYFFVTINLIIHFIPTHTHKRIDYCFILYVSHRLIAAAPCIREQFWSLSKYVLGQLNVIIKSRGRQMSDNSAYKISRNINNKQNPKHVLSHCSSKIDVFHNNQDG